MTTPTEKKPYRIVFREEVEYEVIFESDKPLDEMTDGFVEEYGVETWFYEMDKQKPDWAEKPKDMRVLHRELRTLEPYIPPRRGFYRT